MANFITGREIILAVKKASTWRSAETVGAGNGVLITSESLGDKAPIYLPDDSLAQPDIRDIYKVSQSLTGASIEGYLRYEGWDTLLALALGTAGNPIVHNGTAYYNNYAPADSIAGEYATLAIKKAGTTYGIWEVPSAKITGFNIAARVGELAKIIPTLMGNKIETDGATNDSTSMGTVTYPDRSNVCRMNTSFRIRMNAQAGAALADSDTIYPYGFSLTYERPFKENFESSFEDASEPVQDGFADAKLELNFDKYNSDTILTAIEGETEYKMDISFVGADITGSTSAYTFTIQIPKIQWESAGAPVSGAGTIPLDVAGKLMAVATAPTGMTGITDPLNIYVINTRATDPLA